MYCDFLRIFSGFTLFLLVSFGSAAQGKNHALVEQLKSSGKLYMIAHCSGKSAPEVETALNKSAFTCTAKHKNGSLQLNQCLKSTASSLLDQGKIMKL